jgi:hypothetical protein
MGGNATLKHFRDFVEIIAESFLEPNSGFIFVPPGESRDIVWGPVDYGFQFFKKHWISDKRIEGCGENDKNYFIHFEFKYSFTDKIKLCIHYETYPYMPQNKAICFPAWSTFLDYQKKFIKESHWLLEGKRDHSWELKTNIWQVAVSNFPSNSSIKQIRKWFEAHVRIAESIIDEVIEKVLK